MDRSINRPAVKRLAIIAAILLAPLLAACTPDRPETELSWDVNDHLGAPHSKPAVQYAARDTAQTTAKTAVKTTAKTYVYQGDDYAIPAPKPHAAQAAAHPSNYAPVAEHSLASIFEPSDAVFDWPVSGKVIAGFGTTTNGERNDGINIATAMGAPIRAAASGTVTYAGNELKGYGNLLLLKHANGYVTAYAHADHLIVSRGDSVAKGQVIGYSGTTGDVSTPQLHFEIRRDTTPVDPRILLVARNS
jgi:murein DD-endopeptidase MepM/ murein hydrolase activator NlpD